MIRSIGLCLIVVGAATLGGCADEMSIFGGSRANIAGAASVVDPMRLEPIKVEDLVVTLGGAPADTLEIAIKNYESHTQHDAYRKWMRNTLQDRILLASQSRCGFYEEYLKRFQSHSAGMFGSLATILGGAGAIVTGAQGARLLSGAAGIASGVGAELQKDLFAGLASTVIIPGIENGAPKSSRRSWPTAA